jgi:hypothetical protein
MDGVNFECYSTVCIITVPLNSADVRNLSSISEKVISVHFLTFSHRAHSGNSVCLFVCLFGVCFFFGGRGGSCVFQSICRSADLTVGSCIIDNN